MITSNNCHIPRPRPWGGVQASLRFSLKPHQGEGSACQDCYGMCCWDLILISSNIISVYELDQIEAYLQYRTMSVWIDTDGLYSLMAVTPCRFFDRKTCGCQIHDQENYPLICRNFPEHLCYYRRVMEQGPRTLGTFDLDQWRRYRTNIPVSAGGFVSRLPEWEDQPDRTPPDDGEEIPATIYVAYLCDPKGPAGTFGNYLHFISNFNLIRLVRTEKHWAILYRTRRRKDPPFVVPEVIDGVIMGYPREEQFQPTTAEIASLYQEHGSAFCLFTIEDLKRLTGRKSGDTPRSC